LDMNLRYFRAVDASAAHVHKYNKRSCRIHFQHA